MASKSPRSPLPESEAKQRLAALTLVERAKLVDFAHRMAAGTGWEPGDLLQEALIRVLEGNRSLPADLPTVVALFGIMKSIASAVRKSSEGRIAKGGIELDAAALPEEAAPVEESVDGGLAQQLYDHFAGDEEVQLFLMEFREEKTRDEVCASLSIDHKRYATLRRRLRRALNELRAEGKS